MTANRNFKDRNLMGMQKELQKRNYRGRNGMNRDMLDKMYE